MADLLRYSTRQFLLTMVKQKTFDFAAARQIIKCNLDLIKEPVDSHGRNLLHYACWKNATSAMVIQFIHDCPLAVQHKDSDGWYPLHYACRFNQHESVILLLIKKCPVAVQQKTNGGYYPLHFACQFNQHESVIQLLVKNYPIAVQHKDSDGWYLLHYACRFNQHELVIQLFIKKYPIAVQQKTNDGYYPLHFACQFNQPESVIQLLVKNYPIAVQQQLIKSESYPLHLACENNQSLSVILLLYNHYPIAVQLSDHDGEFPLHLACSANAPLDVIQFLVKQWPDALTNRSKTGFLPLEFAENPRGERTTNVETVQWLENYSESTDKAKDDLPSINLPIIPTEMNTHNTVSQKEVEPTPFNIDFLSDRILLRQCIDQRDQQAELSEEYIKSIKTEKILGSGFFGTVYYGVDSELSHEFAIKTINNDILVEATNENILKIKNTFYTEQKVLINFHHPNIATLLAYSFPTNLRGNYYLLYECAERGSLDKFWKDDTSREQLSWKRRNIIAYEVLTALQFLHKGNDTFQGCFHRDLKSANIVLTKNLTAQLIDCGLAKFVTDKNTRTSSTGVKGTPGYICPEYQSHGFGYTAQCDIFSFGVILTELFTGRLQNYEINASTCFNFLIQYIKKKNTRNLMDDIDSTMMVNSPKFVGAFSELALDCMSELIEDRPTGDEAIGRLALILQADSNVDEGLPDPGNSSASVLGTSLCRRCRTYPKYPNNENCPFCIMIDKQNLTIIKQDITNDMQKVTNDKQFDLEGKLDKIINKLDEILPVLTALDAKFNNPIPRLFFLYPAEKKKVWKNPKSWLNSKMVEKYHLHFVCAHSFQAINPPLKIGITKEWLVRAAPVLAVSLYLMSMALKGTANITIDVTDAAKKLFKIGKDDLQVMIKQAFAVLDERTAIDLKSNLDKNNYVNVLSSTAYDVITKLATEQNKWKENMKQVKQKTSVATLWVAKSIELNEIHGYESVV